MSVVSEIMQKMITYSDGNLHDISHFLKVYAYARTIGEQEQLLPDVLKTLEIAAILHDIACPLCREKYGNTNGKYQEVEGEPLARELLKDTGVSDEMTNRIAYLVAHHHTYTDIDGPDYQILLEADFLVNADESHMTSHAIENAKNSFFSTKTGTKLLDDIYQLERVD